VDEHQHLRESRAVGGVGRSEGVGVERRGQSQSITEEVDDVLLQSASVLHLLCLVPSLCIEQTLNDNVTKKCNVK
jgi:NTP pyrophosphatase (non-canonical NTP hydrolase)